MRIQGLGMVIVATLLAIAGTGCSDDSTGQMMSGTTGGSGAPSASAVRACNDVVSAVEAACVRCGARPGECREAFSSGLLRPCSQAAGVRDSSSLYSTCIPSLGEVACTTLMTDAEAAFGPSCRAQILFNP
jgi:hypothetical protein